MDLAELLQQSPYHRWLGVRLERADADSVGIRLPYRAEFAGGAFIHGGIIASLADIAGCFAVIAAVGRDVPTLNVRVDYLRPAPAGSDLIGVGRTVRVGRTMGVADVTVSTEGGVLVAVARGDFPTGGASA